MSCQDALITKCLTGRPDQTVEVLLRIMRKENASFVPVVEDGILAGTFSTGILLEDLLPVSLMIGGGDDEDGPGPTNIRLPAAPGMSTRLRRNMTATVGAMMQRVIRPLHLDMPLEAAVRALRDAGGPVAVVDRESNKFLGLVTNESVLAALEKKAG